MDGCHVCGKELEGDFQYCPYCAAPLSEQSRPVEERKVISVLFCDLVGFTARSEAEDPEDVKGRLDRYHARVRREIERHGGIVEKFIGDAVMGVFGAPVAHEDDAERAVRAGLAILETIGQLNESDSALALEVRIGINTGEAVVSIAETQLDLGKGIVGDVVNTASRLQAAAPVDAIAVSEQTYRQTERVFRYEELPPVEAKGKTTPLAMWRPLEPRGRFDSGDVFPTEKTPLVGRSLERSLLISTFERSAEQRSCQLVTIVGEPGVGKSRLVAELAAYVDEEPELVTWRQGRCLPYGEGIAFWALGEIVKAECGILESDTPAEAAAKLESVVRGSNGDVAWERARLAPLVGAGREAASQEESFTAWRRFLESLATEHTTVIGFEDVHWADPALLSFIEHVVDWSHGLPLLLLCTARPELFDQHPNWTASGRNATTITLEPLSDEEIASLLSGLLDQRALPSETQRTLIDRAGGNPLYAEEFVRLLSASDVLDDGDVRVPDSVQALIAARLDTLSPDRKSLLQEAAVVGEFFWAGALAEIGGRDLREVELGLHELTRRELVRPLRTSSMQDEAEYAFRHVLIRDVCYAQIPRAARAERHEAAAAWIERKAGERVEDLADILAHHYLRALELMRSARRTDVGGHLEAAALRYLSLAGDRAMALDVERAEASLAAALALAPPGHPRRADLLERWAFAAQQQGRAEEARSALEEALALYREQDEPLAVGRTLSALASVLGFLGDPATERVVTEALGLLEREGAGPELVAAYTELGSGLMVRAAYNEAIAAAEQARALAKELDLPEPVRALGVLGCARAYLGERRGLADMREALRRAVGQGKGRSAAAVHNNLAVAIWQHEGPQAALDQSREGIAFCTEHGIVEFAQAMTAQAADFLGMLGRVDEALALARTLLEGAEGIGDTVAAEARLLELRLLGLRGQGGPEVAAALELVTSVRDTGEPQQIAHGFSVAAQLLASQGQLEEARALLFELSRNAHTRADPNYAFVLPELVRCALALGETALGSELVAGVEPRLPLYEHALCAARAQLSEADGEPEDAVIRYGEAVQRWRAFGNVPGRANALLGRGRCLLALEDDAAATALGEARELFASMGFAPALAEADALLEACRAGANPRG